MTFVRQIAHRVTVLHFGAIFAEGTSRRDRRRRAASPTSISGASMDERHPRTSQDLRAGYGGKPVLQGVTSASARARSSPSSAATASARRTLMKTLIGLHAAPCRADQFRRPRRRRLEPPTGPRAARHRLRPAGPRRLPAHDGAGEPAGRRGGMRGRATPDYDKVYELFPILKERARQRAGTLSGGQQQQLAIGRALIGGPDDDAARRAVRGHPALDRAGDRPHHRAASTRRPGMTVLFVEQNLDLIRRHRAARLRHGQGPHRRRARPA